MNYIHYCPLLILLNSHMFLPKPHDGFIVFVVCDKMSMMSLMIYKKKKKTLMI